MIHWKRTLQTAALSLYAAIAVFSAVPVEAAPAGQLMFILDASSSMLAKDGTATTRIDKAKDALTKTLATLPDDMQVGLRVYGSQVPDTNKVQGCQDSKLIARPAAGNKQALTAAVNDVKAKGWTLMGKSLQDVQQDFSGEGPKTVILLSDGIDTCAPPAACEVAKSLSANGVKIKVNTLGLLVDANARSQLSCIAENSGGNYYDVNDIGSLQRTLAALTAKEVSLFTASGVPIKGNLRMEDAPTVLGGTRYTDNLTLPQELYYELEALPKQNLVFTVKAISRNTRLDNTDALRLATYLQDTGEQLNSVPFSYSYKAFGKGSDVVTATHNLDIGGLSVSMKDRFAKPQRIVLKVWVAQANKSSGDADGTVLPLEISVTATGGIAPNNATPAADKTAQAAGSKTSGTPSPLMIVLMTLGAVAAVGVLADLAYMMWRKKRVQQPPAQPSTTGVNPVDGPPPTNQPPL